MLPGGIAKNEDIRNEYPQMKYHTNLFSISMQKILFWFIFVNLLPAIR